jgi:two-component system CheB/CheR fusion protein
MIVGVGGSAGSLSPLREFIASLPVDCGMAFVVVSHQAPGGHSMLPEILAKCTKLAVSEVGDETRVEPNHVYVEPHGQNVTIRDGVLGLDPSAPREIPHLPIDLFFRALARDQGSHASGVVLSGTGTDGTLGLAAIRGETGLSLVQDPATAEFDGMPASAIQARVVDFVLPPAEMPARLLAHRKEFLSTERADATSEILYDGIQSVLAVMRERGGHDFSEYKHVTLGRRIARRMHLHAMSSVEAYARYLEQSDIEIDALWHDWLIGVSGFFRDAEVFEALESVLPEILAGHEVGTPVRIWVPGCATGEEAYSCAILLLEIQRRLERPLELQVFATDLNPAAIQIASAGRYPEGIAADVGVQRLAQFFVKEDGFYRVTKELRNRVVFAVQDALRDPPFTRIDLVSCRNLLIYVQPEAQRRLLRSFHFGLNTGGLLLLGSSETAGGSEEFFSPLDAHCKIYRRNDPTAPHPTFRWRPHGRIHNPAPTGVGRVEAQADLGSPLRRALAERFGPPSVLVDERGQIQQIHGRVGAYLELPAGRVNVNIVDMARPGLRASIASALREVIRADGRVVERSVRLKVDGDSLTLELKVSRLHDARQPMPLFLVSFESAKARSGKGTRDAETTSEAGPVRDELNLEHELQNTRQDLRGSIENLQAANEELAAANEEAQSANEELQSTNEELQTAKEETQSLNEELHTVNAEITLKLETFERATDDLLNLMNNIDIATIFLDAELRVKRFTPQARRVAHLIDADIGRPLSDLATHLDYPELLLDAATVIETLQPSEKQAVAPDESWYLVRIRPYRTARNVVEGAVVTFVDITDAKCNERLLSARILAESIVDAVREPLLVLDDEIRIIRANHAYYQAFRTQAAETEGRFIRDLGIRSIPMLPERLKRVLKEGASFDDFEVEVELPGLGRRRLLSSARVLTPKNGTAGGLILLGFEEVSEPEANGTSRGGESP